MIREGRKKSFVLDRYSSFFLDFRDDVQKGSSKGKKWTPVPAQVHFKKIRNKQPHKKADCAVRRRMRMSGAAFRTWQHKTRREA
jgi:hypothetical protein